MDLLLWTSVLTVCAVLCHTESRSLQSTVSDQDLISHPGVHYTVKPLSISSPTVPSSQLLLPTEPLNPLVMMHTKSPAPEEPVGSERTGHPVPRPFFRRRPAVVRDPLNSSARVPGEKGALGMMLLDTYKANKKSPRINRLASVIRGIYWSMDTTAGQGQVLSGDLRNLKVVSDAEKWIRDVRTHRRVVHMEIDEQRCGRNFLVRFDDGNEACAKQRRNYDQIQGEIFAYLLSDLLMMRHHLPPTVLVKAMHSRLFESVMGEIQHDSTWDPTKPFIITKYLTNLKPLLLPAILQPLIKSIVRAAQEGVKIQTQSAAMNETFVPPTNAVSAAVLDSPLISPRSQQLGLLSKEELHQLSQWSDMVIFDYLCGNLDRLVNAAVNLQWHDQMLALPVHNAFQTSDDGNFIFMDNESGLFHGYRLLDQYDKYLQPLLRSFCVFNKSTVNAIKKLHQSRSAGPQLMKMVEPKLLKFMPGIGPKTSQILQKRLRYVYSHIRFCEDNYFLP